MATYMSKIEEYAKRPKNMVFVRSFSPKTSCFNPKARLKEIEETIKKAYNDGIDLLFFAGETLSSWDLAFCNHNPHLYEEKTKILKSMQALSVNYQGLVIAFGFSKTYENPYANMELVVILNGEILSPLRNENSLSSQEDIYLLPLFCDQGKLRGTYKMASLLGEQISNLKTQMTLKEARIELLLISSRNYASAALANKKNNEGQLLDKISSLASELKSHVVYASPSSAEPSSDYLSLAFHIHMSMGAETRTFSEYELIKDEFIKKADENEGAFAEISLDSVADLEYLQNLQMDIKLINEEAKIFTKKLEEEKVKIRAKYEDCHALNLPAWRGFNFNISHMPYCPKEEKEAYYEQILSELAYALALRMRRSKQNHLVLGLSGGMDSTVALAIAIRALGKNIYNQEGEPRLHLYTMPAYGTSNESLTNAKKLAKAYNLPLTEINISEACDLHFKLIDHQKDKLNNTFENAQARMRTQILMDLANDKNALVLGTGDASEIALGFATYNGDHMSMYACNASLPKSIMKELLIYEGSHQADKYPLLKEAFLGVCKLPYSPELLPLDQRGLQQQKSEDKMGSYLLHDFFNFYHMERKNSPLAILFYAEQAFVKTGMFSNAIVIDTLFMFYKRLFSQQFKRTCSPEGAAILPMSFSPRGEKYFPSDLEAGMYLEEIARIRAEFSHD